MGVHLVVSEDPPIEEHGDASLLVIHDGEGGHRTGLHSQEFLHVSLVGEAEPLVGVEVQRKGLQGDGLVLQGGEEPEMTLLSVA